ncbi:MAG: hypothetical protein IT178_12075 [Acidobacteria bacterium]|nr:hypothetical protein [Acidobacteriota bacterium]
MADPGSSHGGIGKTAFSGLLLIALGCGLEAIFPTVRVSCPARTASAPDCDLRSSIAFDQVTVRHAPLPALQPIGEIEFVRTPRGRGGTPTLYFDTAAGRVSAIRWGDQLSLQKDLQEPLRAYLADPHAPAIAVTMRPTHWVDPGGNAANRLVRNTHPGKLAANALIIGGLLFWMWLPVELVTSLARRARA